MMVVEVLFRRAQKFVASRAPIDDLPFRPDQVVLKVGCRLAEKDHREDPRYFAHVFHGPRRICVCESINMIPLEHIWGILLHEFGHLYGGAQDAEADLWVQDNLGVDIDYVNKIQWADLPEKDG